MYVYLECNKSTDLLEAHIWCSANLAVDLSFEGKRKSEYCLLAKPSNFGFITFWAGDSLRVFDCRILLQPVLRRIMPLPSIRVKQSGHHPPHHTLSNHRFPIRVSTNHNSPRLHLSRFSGFSGFLTSAWFLFYNHNRVLKAAHVTISPKRGNIVCLPSYCSFLDHVLPPPILQLRSTPNHFQKTQVCRT